VQTSELLHNIDILPLGQKLSIIENLLQSVKNDVLTDFKNTKPNTINILFRLLTLNNESNTIQTLYKETERQLPITRGDKTLNPTALFGMWENVPRTIEEIRIKKSHTVYSVWLFDFNWFWNYFFVYSSCRLFQFK